MKPFALTTLTLLAFTPAPYAQVKLEYNRDIRPILAENCFACHGPDSASRKAGLRLDHREDALKAEAFIPGAPAKSELVSRIFADKSAKLMPPAKSHKKLTAAEKEKLKRWIAEGAEYQSHWSFIPAKKWDVPGVKNAKWVRNPIDAFVLATLEKQGLQPAPEADRRTLARRLSLDLTGLPPAPAEVEAFVADKSPNAYEKYVDQLLASPHWGEHRGRYWLDVARYADSHGIHFDNYREIWAYRDWVIRAFNNNQPFDQFTIEQLAGDLLPRRSLDQLVATGFNRCNITTNEGGVIAEEYLVLYTRDRTETFAQTWLGLTAGCAVCHDHKFDPLTMRDFYALAAFFNNTTQGAMDGNIKDTPPVIVVPNTTDRARWEKVSQELDAVKKKVDERRQDGAKEFESWLRQAKSEQIAANLPSKGLKLSIPLDEGAGKSIALTVDGKLAKHELLSAPKWDAGHVAAKAARLADAETLSLPEAGDFDQGQAFSYGAWIKIPKRGTIGAVFARMDEKDAHRGWDLWIEGDRVGAHIINDWPNNAIKVLGTTQLQPANWYHVFVTHDGSGKSSGVKVYVNGQPEPIRAVNDNLKNTIRTKVPFKLGQRHGSSRIANLLVQDVRIYDRALSGLDVQRLARSTRAAHLLRQPIAKLKQADRQELFDWWLLNLDKNYASLAERLNALQQEEAQIRARGTIAYITQERDAEPTAYILYRGDYDKRKDQVKAATPPALPAMAAELPRNRLGLAKWVLQPENPLTARVTVNRFWQEIFGTGIVRTSGDFGVTGELPSHPELLDWLAINFREYGWDVKKFFKLIVTSATYRQSALVTPDKLEKDPHNRLLSRGPRYRLDAEMIRDYALAASGLLVPRIGGPSVKPYQPQGVWEAVAMIGSNTRDYKADKGESLYRRSMYTFWKRAAPPASMEILNAPNRETCTVRRETTNTPLQALVTLNDPQLVEAARFLAQKALKEGGATVESKIDFLGRRLLARPFRDSEMQVIKASLADLAAFYQAHADDARKLINVGESRPDAAVDVGTLASWTMLVNELMNLDEVLNK